MLLKCALLRPPQPTPPRGAPPAGKSGAPSRPPKMRTYRPPRIFRGKSRPQTPHSAPHTPAPTRKFPAFRRARKLLKQPRESGKNRLRLCIRKPIPQARKTRRNLQKISHNRKSRNPDLGLKGRRPQRAPSFLLFARANRRVWRCRLLSDTVSPSTIAIFPTPEAASSGSAPQPTPPAPTTKTSDSPSALCPSAPNPGSAIWRAYLSKWVI